MGGEMVIRNCKVVAVDGTHETGKSTLVAGLAAYLKSLGVNAAHFTEVARRSPYLEEAFFQPDGIVDIFTELSLFTTHVTEELNAARHHDILICDRTALNVLGYADVYLTDDGCPSNDSYVRAMREFARHYGAIYDIVFYLTDRYTSPYVDPYRPVDESHRDAVDVAVQANYSALGINVVTVPVGLSLAEKVAWTGAKVVDLLPLTAEVGQ
jgi:nicotinamide riboside kinase